MEPTERFPLLGFPDETNQAEGNIVYQCRLGGGARIALWKWRERSTYGANYALNIYCDPPTVPNSLTHLNDRFHKDYNPVYVDDALEAQLAIFHLIEKFSLPTEVTQNEPA